MSILVTEVAHASNETFDHSYHFSCIPNGNGTFHFSFPVFSRASKNHWASSGTEIYATWGGTKTTIVSLGTKNQSGVTVGYTHDVDVDILNGSIVANDKLYEGKGQKIQTDKAKIIEVDQPTTFLSFDWIPVQGSIQENDKITFAIHIMDETYLGDPSPINYELGTYSYFSTIKQPTLMEPYIDMEAGKGKQGSMKFSWMSIKEVHEYQVVVAEKGKEPKTIDIAMASPASYGDFTLDQSNQGAQVYIKAKMYADDTKKAEVTVNSNVVSMKPYHNLNGEFKSTNKEPYNCAVTNLNWNLKDYNEEDYIASDAFQIKRDYSPDFGNATTIAKVFFSDSVSCEKEVINEKSDDPTYRVAKVNYALTDSSFGCAFNPNDLYSKDSVFVFAATDPVNYAAENTNALFKELVGSNEKTQEFKQEFLKMLMVPKRVIYYSLERSSSVSLWDDLDPALRQVDSVYKVLQMPLISEASVVKEQDWENKRQVTLSIKLNNYTLKELPAYKECTRNRITWDKSLTDLYPYKLYTWDPNAKLKIVRRSRETGDSTIISINGSQVKKDTASNYYVTVNDYINEAFTHYSYTVVIDTSESYLPINPKGLIPVNFTIDNDSLYYDNAATIAKFQASKDNCDYVDLKWERNPGPFSSYLLTRQEGHNEPEVLELSDSTVNFFYDKTAKIGVEYRYFIQTVYYHNGRKYVSEASRVWGKRSDKGIIKGRVTTASNIGVANINVVAIGKANNDTIRTTTNSDGSYMLECEAKAEGSEFAVMIVGSQATNYQTKNGENLYTVNLSEAKMTHADKDFTCSKVRLFVGRALYENTTVPVKDAHIKVNGSYLYDASGSLLASDSYGNFSFEVPEAEMTVQIVKNGHTFRNHGYIHDIDGTVSDTVFTPTIDYKGLEIYDSTTIRLAGRIAAGKDQAELPLGFGLSENYIGDSLTLVMELEGDQTSLLVFDKTGNITSTDTVVEHPCNKKLSTKVTTERKRVVIKPDTSTGEFYVDLLPVRYKITQMYADGYPSLFSAGEAAQIIDLSIDSLTSLKEYDYQVDQKKTLHTAYNKSYVREYHAPVELSYYQLNYGMDSKKLGDQYMTTQNVYGKEFSFNLISNEDTKTKEVTYVFGYPVFSSKSNYTIYAYAKEAYYYNGKKQGDADAKKVYYAVVPNATLIVSNGLTTDNTPQSIEMDGNGMASFSFVADNPTFRLREEDALRYLNMSVLSDGYYYNAKPLAAFVTGIRQKGTDSYDFMIKDASIKLLDVLRDPPGAGSSAYIENGTKYSYERTTELSVSAGININIKSGSSFTNVVGAVSSAPGSFVGSISKGNNTFDQNIPIVPLSYAYNRNASYEFEVTQKIETSDDPENVGAMADVYIGTTENMAVGKADVLSLIDYDTYKLVQPSIASGKISVLAKSADAEGDSASAYLVVAEKLAFNAQLPVTFVYTQKHIITNVIPNIIRERDALIYTCDSTTAVGISEKSHKITYYSKVPLDDENFGLEGYYGIIKPDTVGGYDEVAQLNRLAKKWMNIIATNEAMKVRAIQRSTKKNNDFILTDAVKIEREEAADMSDSERDRWASPEFFWNTGGNALSALVGAGVETALSKFEKDEIDFREKRNDKEYTNLVTKINQIYNSVLKNDSTDGKKTTDALDTTRVKKIETFIETPMAKFTIGFSPLIDFQDNSTFSYSLHTTKKTGFTLKTTKDSYLDIALYAVPYDSALYTDENIRKYFQYVTKDKWDPEQEYMLSDYMFYVKSGATRLPYEKVDSTIFYNSGTPLGATTLKIEQPKIEISNPIVSNVPQDQKAIFSVKLINNSESQNAINNELPSTFVLRIDDETNTNGAKVYMDGMPITDGRKFDIPCGQYVTKTIEVERGVGFDIDNLGLFLHTDMDELNDYDQYDEAYLSVKYLPTSCPIQIISPVDKWVLNTLSQHDSLGFYIPVEVSGFNVNYDGFDHIEIQYKESNRGEDSWTNLCSYFADPELYEKASGNKKLLTSGAIKLPFHGEKDPMEMKYDIRAVSFCRLGNSYVTRFSDVVSGIKDTRYPSVFGLPEPTNGILMYGDVIKLPFTEPIAYNYLDKTANFEIVGYKNSTSLSEGSALKFAGNENQKAQSEVERNLVEHNFTIDMMVMANETNKDMTFFSHGDDIQNMTFGVNSNNQLVAKINSDTFVSKELVVKLTSAFKRVGLMVNNKTQKVSFFIGNEVLPTKGNDSLSNPYRGNGPVYLGTDITSPKENLFSGSMLEVRLWGDTLTSEELSAYNSKLLTNHERELIAHYPLTETIENIAYDEVNGANLVLENTSWATKNGRCLSTGTKPVEMNPDFTSTNVTSDFSLMFWFKSQDKLDANTDTLAIFTAGAESLPDSGFNKLFIGYEAEKLVVRSNGVSYSLGNTYTDAEWHHFTMTINRSKNAANFYIDGDLVSQLSAKVFGGIASDYAALGNRKMKFNIDYFTLWKLALPSSFIAKKFNNIHDESDTNIRLYLPFEQNVESDQGMVESTFSPYNEKREYDSNVNIYRKKDLVLTNVTDENIDNSTWAPVTQAARLSKLDFTWASTDQVLLINLLENDKDINNQEIYFTVKNVEDLNGNVMQNPEMWSVYTRLNQLSFTQKEVVVSTEYGETYPFKLDMSNVSGSTRNYKISCTSDWLVPEEPLGSCEPAVSQVVPFTVKGINDPGYYFDIISLEDENGLISSCIVDLVVTGNKPAFEVNKSNFDYTMVYKGQVMLKSAAGNDVIDNNEDDVVYAFIDDKCVGKSNIEVSDNDRAYVYMTIYGTADNSNNADAVTFRLWNSTNNKLISLVSSSAPVRFVKDGMVGCSSTIDTLRESQTKIRNLNLTKGWNWISVNVKPTESKHSVSNLFMSNTTPFSSGDLIKSPSNYDEYSKGHGVWTNKIKTIGCDTVYLVRVAADGIYSIVGDELTEDDMTIHVKGGQWSHLPYLLDATLPINTALSSLQYGVSVKAGDIVKSIDKFAFLSEDNVWEGNLKYFKPGEGYFINLQGAGEHTITYNKKSAGVKSLRSLNTNASVAKHANNMPVIAQLADGINFEENDRLVAYANGEKAGEAYVREINGKNMFLISVNAEDGDAVVFAQERDGETLASTHKAVKYDANGVLGSAENPYTIEFAEQYVTATPTLFTDDVKFSININSEDKGTIKVYNNNGLLVWYTDIKDITNADIYMNGSSFASGVYYAVTNIGDVVETIKLIKE